MTRFNFISCVALASVFATSCAAQDEAAASQADVTMKTSKSAVSSEVATIKPGAAVDIKASGKTQLNVGEDGDLMVTVQDFYEEGTLIVNVGATQGLRVYPTSAQASFDMSDSAAHTMRVNFTATENGQQYLNFQAQTTDSMGNTSFRSHSIAVQVGDPANNVKKTNGTMVVQPDSDQGIMVMDAEETIDGQ